MKAEFEGRSNLSGIYKITNLSNGKVYIGSTMCFRKRHYQHVYALERNTHSSKHLQHAYNSYGKEFFLFEILEVVDEPGKLLSTEQKFLDCHFGNECYNLNSKAKHTHKRKFSQARKLSKEHKKKISEAHLGKKLSEEHKEAIRINAKSNPNYGMKNKHHSSEYRKNLSEQRSKDHSWRPGGFLVSSETKQKLKRTYKCILLDPHGTIYFGFVGLDEFCIKHQLSRAGLKFLINGQRQTHKGWKLLPSDYFKISYSELRLQNTSM